MVSEISFEKFYKKFGYIQYPFNSFTAEDEKERQSRLFISTQKYSPILEAFLSKSSMLLLGDRGTGKTSILYDFTRQAPSNRLVCKIDDFSGLKTDFSDADFYNFVLRSSVNRFFEQLSTAKLHKKKISDKDKILLTYFFINFADDATRGLAKRMTKEIQFSPFRRKLRGFYDFFRHPFNMAANFGVNLLADVVAKSTGTNSQINAEVTEYFPELKVLTDEQSAAPSTSLDALRRFVSLVRSTTFDEMAIIFDKVDEDPRLENDAEKIASFVKKILSNNAFLVDENFQVVVSLWTVPFNFILENVRTQKIYTAEIKWEYGDLQDAFNKRIEEFSKGECRTFNATFAESVNKEMKDSILDLSNRNPRDLWHLMNKIFRAQYNHAPESDEISVEAAKAGMEAFVKEFNLYEYYPRKSNARANSMDVYAYAKHLLKLDQDTFTRNKLNEQAGTGSSTANYVGAMENLGLIGKVSSDGGEVIYRIRDPKIRYAQANKFDISAHLR